MADRPRLRVVIAEDEAIIRLDLCELLTEEGYDRIILEAYDDYWRGRPDRRD